MTYYCGIAIEYERNLDLFNMVYKPVAESTSIGWDTVRWV